MEDKQAKIMLLHLNERGQCRKTKWKSLPPNISWADVLVEKLTPSEDTTGKWEASTTSFEWKGLRFGMDSSPASAEVKGSTGRQKERERDRRKWNRPKTSGEELVDVRKESMQSRSKKDAGGDRELRRWRSTCPRRRHREPWRGGLHGWLERGLKVKQVTLHFHCAGNITEWGIIHTHKIYIYAQGCT